MFAQENKGRIDFDKSGNWQYKLSVDYDIERNCEENFCDFICRCGVIVDPKIEPLQVIESAEMARTFFKDAAGQEGNFGAALANRFFRNAFCDEMFVIEVSRGYYGEEIDGVFVSQSSLWERFDKQVDAFNSISNPERLKMVLQMEYGYVLPDVLQHSDWILKEVLVEQIHADKKVLSGVSFNMQHQYDMLTPWYYSKHYANLVKDWFPAVVVVPRPDGKLRVIDGFHRLASWTSKPNGVSEKTWKKLRKNKKIKVIMPSS